MNARMHADVHVDDKSKQVVNAGYFEISTDSIADELCDFGEIVW